MATDEPAQARAHDIFDPIVAGHLARPGVDMGPMFSSVGLRIRGKVFAFLGSGGQLVIKIPEARADELVADTAVERMVMRERPMREWVVMDTDAAQLWEPLIGEALAYVDEITP